jgi:phosphate/sulfate permease
VYGGKDAVNWATPDTTKFPPYSGVVPIVSAWIFAPLATAAAAALIMVLCRTLVLRRPNPARLAMFVLPLAVFLTTWVSAGGAQHSSGDGDQLASAASERWALPELLRESAALWMRVRIASRLLGTTCCPFNHQPPAACCTRRR